MPDIPKMVVPSAASTMVFVAIIAFVAVAFAVGIRKAKTSSESNEITKRWTTLASFGMIGWLAINWIIPNSGILESNTLPPRPLFLFVFCLLLAMAIAFSAIGKRLAQLSFAALVGFHAFRFPLELVLHNWYKAGTMPVQMTFEGHNFDIVSGLLSIAVGGWALMGKPPKIAIWIFNLLSFGLLMAVIFIATTSSPVPFRQYLNDPPVLLVFHAPYSWIVSIAVTGAFTAHLILFRKLVGNIHCERHRSQS